MSAQFETIRTHSIEIINNILTLLSTLTFTDIITGLSIYVFVLWGAIVLWVIRDITARSESLLLQVFCTLLILVGTPIFGLPIYLLLRPSMTLFERSDYDEIEDNDSAIDPQDLVPVIVYMPRHMVPVGAQIDEKSIKPQPPFPVSPTPQSPSDTPSAPLEMIAAKQENPSTHE